MKIGILTFHRAYNYGAFLQCYSLLTNLKKDVPFASIEVIDYQSKNMYDYYKTDLMSFLFGHSNNVEKLTLRKRLSKAKQFIKKVKHDRTYVSNIRQRNKRFAEAVLNIQMSDQRLVSDDYQECIDFINSQNYDLIVVGSDAIWNDYQTSMPNIFYLNPKIKSKFVSYAASTFGMDYTKKTMTELEEIEKSINCFQYIGVRDKATEDYLKLMNVKVPVSHTCDPSIILDLGQEVFNINRIIDKLKDNGIDFSKPIFGVMGGDWLGKIARDLIGKDAQLISLYEPNKYADLFLSDLSPFEWAKVFSLFTMTFTHFFHGTLFSLKNGVPTMSIEWENDYSDKFETKILDVLKRLDIEDYRFTKKEAENNFGLIKTHFDRVMDNMATEKERIKKGLSMEQETYKKFLNDVKGIIEV